MEGSLGRGFGQVLGWVRRDPQAVQIGAAESGGKTWRKKIGGTGVAVHSTVMVPVRRNIILPPP
jgi:predicted secreted protein